MINSNSYQSHLTIKSDHLTFLSPRSKQTIVEEVSL